MGENKEKLINNNRACVFAHYDQDNKVDDYVFYCLNELLNVTEKLVFVTVSRISNEDIMRLKSLNVDVILRENKGYDFYSYKVGLDSIEFSKYEAIILCNDSVYGPLLPLRQIFEEMRNRNCDFWGITESKSISHHIQSYFIVYRSNIINTLVFKEFWENLIVLHEKHQIVKECEVGLSKRLYSNDFSSCSYIENTRFEVDKKERFIELLIKLLNNPMKIVGFLKSPQQYFVAINRKSINPSLEQWKESLLNNKLPFLKVSLFRSEESKEKALTISKIVQKNTKYPVSLILNHYKRIKKK